MQILEIKTENFLPDSFKYGERELSSSNLSDQTSTFISNDRTRYILMPKFMQSLGIETYHRLLTEAKARDVTVQSLIRTVIVPEWLNTAPGMKPSIQTTIASPIAQPGTYHSHPRIPTDTPHRTL